MRSSARPRTAPLAHTAAHTHDSGKQQGKATAVARTWLSHAASVYSLARMGVLGPSRTPRWRPSLGLGLGAEVAHALGEGFERRCGPLPPRSPPLRCASAWSMLPNGTWSRLRAEERSLAPGPSSHRPSSRRPPGDRVCGLEPRRLVSVPHHGLREALGLASLQNDQKGSPQRRGSADIRGGAGVEE